MTDRGTAQYWFARAEEARVKSETFSNPIAKQSMLVISEQYEVIALRHEDIERRIKAANEVLINEGIGLRRAGLPEPG